MTASDDRVMVKALETVKNILLTGDQEAKAQKPLDEMERALLSRFEVLSVDPSQSKAQAQLDSSYGSMTDLFTAPPGQNPFRRLFEMPLVKVCNNAGSAQVSAVTVPTGVDRLRQLSDSNPMRSFHLRVQCPSREVRDLAQDIVKRWFL
jgi:hypothetical protein